MSNYLQISFFFRTFAAILGKCAQNLKNRQLLGTKKEVLDTRYWFDESPTKVRCALDEGKS